MKSFALCLLMVICGIYVPSVEAGGCRRGGCGGGRQVSLFNRDCRPVLTFGHRQNNCCQQSQQYCQPSINPCRPGLLFAPRVSQPSCSGPNCQR